MKLDRIKEEQSLCYMERYVDEGVKNYSPFAARTETEPDFQPRAGRPWFELITTLVPREQVTIFQSAPSSNLREFYLRPEGVLFAVHPEIWSSPAVEFIDRLRPLPRAAPVRVAPTASTRTVLTLEKFAGVAPHFVKLHYPRMISRFNRRLRRLNIQNSVAVSAELAHIQFNKFAFLPDVLGVVLGEGRPGWGFLVRERVARPAQAGEKYFIPFFSLYARDLKNPDDPPLLCQLIEHLGADPPSFVVEEIMVPVVECWAKVVQERGILLESHGQNMLLEIDAGFRPRRIVHRDFDLWIDHGARRKAGLGTPFIGVGVDSGAGHSLEQHYSLVYDRFIGHELFDYLLRILTEFYGVSEMRVRERVKDAFHRAFPGAGRVFPEQTTYYFSNEPRPGHESELVDLKQAPAWR